MDFPVDWRPSNVGWISHWIGGFKELCVMRVGNRLYDGILTM